MLVYQREIHRERWTRENRRRELTPTSAPGLLQGSRSAAASGATRPLGSVEAAGAAPVPACPENPDLPAAAPRGTTVPEKGVASLLLRLVA